MHLTRRNVIAMLAAGSAAPLTGCLSARRGGGSIPGLSREDYGRMTVIDAKCFLRESNPRTSLPQGLSDSLVTAARASGLTMISATMGGSGLMEETARAIADMDARIASQPDTFMRVLTASELHAAKQSRRIGISYDVQGTAEIGADAAGVARLRDLGVRTVQLTYNLRTAAGDGCLVPDDGGLTDFGRQVIGEINRLGLLLDLSHAGQRTAADAVAATTAAPAITHAGCFEVTRHPRHVPDSTLRLLADKGGVFGIYLMPYLRPLGQADREDVLRHIEHAIDVCGEDHVGIGTDGGIPPLDLTPDYRDYWRTEVYEPRVQSGVVAPNEGADIFNYVPEYNSVDRYHRIGDDLVRRGHSTARVEKILGANFARLYGQVWA